MKRLLVVFIGLLLGFVALSSPTLIDAAGGTVPFTMSCMAHPQIVGGGQNYFIVATPADCIGTHVGNSDWYSDITVFIDPVDPYVNPAPQYGDMVITAADGSQLFGHYEGENVLNDVGGFDYWGTYQITGGTGRFSGTTGSGIYYGGGVGPNPFTYEGELTNP